MATVAKRRSTKKDPKTTKKMTVKKKSLFWRIGYIPTVLVRWGFRFLVAVLVLVSLMIAAYTQVNPPTTVYIIQEGLRLGGIRREWRDFEDISPHLARAIVAAEDANFCNHWGFDMEAIRDALEKGGRRGASTISQQTVKNVYLWHGRNWTRKALEALMTPAVEAVWSKRRILEVYMNVAEFDEGVFGVAAASRWYFGVDAKDLNLSQASRLAAVLPNPKGRSAINPTPFLKKRARSIAAGAQTILLDGRSDCFDG